VSSVHSARPPSFVTTESLRDLGSLCV
jgi:hypothetical protein